MIYEAKWPFWEKKGTVLFVRFLVHFSFRSPEDSNFRGPSARRTSVLWREQRWTLVKYEEFLRFLKQFWSRNVHDKQPQKWKYGKTRMFWKSTRCLHKHLSKKIVQKNRQCKTDLNMDSYFTANRCFSVSQHTCFTKEIASEPSKTHVFLQFCVGFGCVLKTTVKHSVSASTPYFSLKFAGTKHL